MTDDTRETEALLRFVDRVQRRLRAAEEYLERLRPVAKGDSANLQWARLHVRRAIEEAGSVDR